MIATRHEFTIRGDWGDLKGSSVGRTWISYSEGLGDDLNKAIWSAIGQDPSLSAVNVTTQYARYVRTNQCTLRQY